MNQCKFFKFTAQQGDILIESMIGMVLMAIISVGMIHVSSKAAVAQKDMRVQEIVVNQLRAALIRNKMGTWDICTSVPDIQLPNNQTLAVEVQGCNGGTTTATVAGIAIAGVPTPIALSVNDPSVGGRIVVGGTWTTN